MKKFILHLLAFTLVLVVMDQIGGRLLLKLYFDAKQSFPAKLNYVVHNSTEDILIFGSSRGYRHYNPAIIAEESSMSVYNASIQGNGIVLANGLYLISRKHHVPKTVLIDIFYEYDQTTRFQNTRFIDLLKPLYGESPELQEYFKRIDPWTPLTMKSLLYRTNSQLFSILKNQKQPEHFHNGFDPLPPVPKDPVGKKYKIDFEYESDNFKVQLMEEMIELMKKDGVRVILVFSPIWHDVDGFKYRDSLQVIANRHHVEFWDYTSHDSITANDFYDRGHLNGVGADRFSRLIGQRLKN